jgi:O-acetyl-ADP-ribose deacetylase (regulator of RNase III)
MQRAYDVLGGQLQIHLGDITRLDVDAIVNSENSDLLMDLPGGPSVSGAIRRVEGEPMARALARLGPLEPGRAVVLPAQHLPCRWVIHAATVVQTEVGHRSSPEIIGRAVRSALQLAAGLGLGSVAFPAFGVRAADVPAREASQAMVQALVDALREQSTLRRVVVALLDPESFLAFYEEAMKRASHANEPLQLRLQRDGDRLTWSLPHGGAVESLATAPLDASVLDDLHARLGRLRDQAGRRLLDSARELDALSARVDAVVPPAVRERLADALPRPLVFNLDPELASIPFELSRAGGDDPLLLRTQVSRSLRLDGARPGRQDPREGAFRVLVLPGRGGDLRGAQEEAASVMDLLWRRGGPRTETTLLGGPRATATAVVDALGAADLVHWCGHTNTAVGSWELGAGVITPVEIAALPRSPSLVIANSCGGPRDLAIARAFLAAGADHCVTTWWDVDDRVASRFATVLYDELLQGHSLGESVHQARRRLHGDDALHWAAYAHYGDPRRRVFHPHAL